jgi:hypothetical protein
MDETCDIFHAVSCTPLQNEKGAALEAKRGLVHNMKGLLSFLISATAVGGMPLLVVPLGTNTPPVVGKKEKTVSRSAVCSIHTQNTFEFVLL